MTGLSLPSALLVPFGLGLLGFVEPCTIGSSLIFIKHIEGRGAGGKLAEVGLFAATRAVFMCARHLGGRDRIGVPRLSKGGLDRAWRALYRAQYPPCRRPGRQADGRSGAAPRVAFGVARLGRSRCAVWPQHSSLRGAAAPGIGRCGHRGRCFGRELRSGLCLAGALRPRAVVAARPCRPDSAGTAGARLDQPGSPAAHRSGPGLR